MSIDYKEILKKLCLTPGPSGFEEESARLIQNYFSNYCDEVEIDFAGNVIGTINGKDSGLPPVMVNAHMDRVGFIVSMINNDGLIKLRAIGGPNEKTLPGLVLKVRKKDHSGWVPIACGVKCVHKITENEKSSELTINDIFFDTGAADAQEVRALGIEIGCPVVFNPSFEELSAGTVCATALDNCGSVAALIGIAEALHNERPIRTTFLVANVWEEYNQRGTKALVRRFHPVAVISMDMLLAADTPDLEGSMQSALGGGPAASCFNYSFDSNIGCIAHEGLYTIAEKAASSCGCNLQRYVCGGCGDNAHAMYEEDYPAVIEIGAPVRYAHSPAEVANINDMIDTSRTVSKMIQMIDTDFNQHRY